VPTTLYLPIKLNKTVLPKVGVFIPEHFKPSAAVDLIVYFHGNILPICKTEPGLFKTKGIEYYLDTPLFKCLREELNASKANAILIAPTFSTKFGSLTATWSPRYGNLNEDGKFDFLINEALTPLKGSKALPADAQIGKIILSAHSAGGVPMMKILSAKQRTESKYHRMLGLRMYVFWHRTVEGLAICQSRQPVSAFSSTGRARQANQRAQRPQKFHRCSTWLRALHPAQ